MGIRYRSFGIRILLSALFLAIVAVAAVLRLADLANRPMHCDEAVHAIKFGDLLEKDEYKYDPFEYHGPLLNYLTLPIAWYDGASKLTQITEIHLRLLPAVFGILLVALAWLLRRDLGWVATLSAALLTAISPAMVFYSRYYIQEMLLVCFTFGAIIGWWRFLRCFNRRTDVCEDGNKPSHTSPKRERGTEAETEAEPSSLALRAGVEPDRPQNTQLTEKTSGVCETLESRRLPKSETRLRLFFAACFWLVFLGASLALMHASKETCIIAMFGLAVGTCAIAGYVWRIVGWRLALAVLVVLATATTISATFFSSFGANWQGVSDSFTTFSQYIGRASGEGDAGDHVHRWHYYLRIVFWWHQEGGNLWTEGIIAALALVGLVAGMSGRGLGSRTAAPSAGNTSGCRRILRWFDSPPPVALARLLAVYTVAVAIVYAAIPYKTPWCALGFLHGTILLAGVGVGVLMRIAPRWEFKVLLFVALLVPTGHLALQAHRASFVAYEDRHNPYVYSHTTSDVPLFVDRLRDIALTHDDGLATHVQVICPDRDYWPLPWYMRDFTQVGYYKEEPPPRPDGKPGAAPVIIYQSAMRDKVDNYLQWQQPPGYRFLIFNAEQAREGNVRWAFVELPPKDNGNEWQFRPFVPISAYVRHNLWRAYEEAKEDEGP